MEEEKIRKAILEEVCENPCPQNKIEFFVSKKILLSNVKISESKINEEIKKLKAEGLLSNSDRIVRITAKGEETLGTGKSKI